MSRSCVEQRSDYLVSRFRKESHQADALAALQDMDSPILSVLIKEALEGKPSGTTSAALEVIDDWDDASWCHDIRNLLGRIKPNGEIPEPHVWYMCARFLLRHGQALGIKQQLRRLKSNSLGDASLLALEYFPDIAIETFRRALRSEIPCNRITAAAALAILDRPWSRSELSAVLSESDDHVKTSECRSALLATHSLESHESVLDWEQRNPREPEQGPGISVGEISLRTSDSTINWEMEQLHERVLPLRKISPKPPKQG